MIINELNTMKPNRFHYKLLLIAGIGWAFDAMDTGIISFIMPLLTKEWHLTGTEIGMLGSVGLLGMAIGAVLAGALADHIGRKKSLLGPCYCTVLPRPCQPWRLTTSFCSSVVYW